MNKPIERLGHSAPPSPLGRLWRSSSRAVPASARVEVRRAGQLYHARGLQVTDGLLLSYPKSGSTWLRNMLAIAIAGRETTPDEIATHVPPLHMTRRTDRNEPMIFRSHDSIGTPGFSRAGRVVALVRDPRAVAVSYSFHRRKRGMPDTTVAVATEQMLGNGFEYLGSWQSHVDQLAVSTGDHLLIVRYEDLLEEPHEWLSAIIAHFGIEASSGDIELAIELTRPDILRQRRIRSGLERSDDEISDIRRASASSWREECPSEVQQQILSAAGEQMRWLAYAPIASAKVVDAASSSKPMWRPIRRFERQHAHAPLVVIGAQKAGTLSLTHDLGTCNALHVDVGQKERSGLLWGGPEWLWRVRYSRHLPRAGQGERAVDISTRYSMNPVETVDVDRLVQLFEDGPKIVYVVRRPVERATSHLHHDTVLGLTDASFDEAATPFSSYVGNSRYAYQIDHWLRSIPSDDILLVDFDDYVAHRRAVVERICAFAGVDTRGTDRIDPDVVHNATSARRSMPSTLARVVRSGPYRLIGRKFIPRALRSTVQTSVERSAPATPAGPTAASRARIAPLLAADLECLRTIRDDAPKWASD